MRRARRLYVVSLLLLPLPVVFAQTPPAHDRGDLDVTMRVIVDPDAKVPDEIVRRIPLPKPGQPATSSTPQSDKHKSEDPRIRQAEGSASPQSREQGRESGAPEGQTTFSNALRTLATRVASLASNPPSGAANERSEEARRNNQPGPPKSTGRPARLSTRSARTHRNRRVVETPRLAAIALSVGLHAVRRAARRPPPTMRSHVSPKRALLSKPRIFRGRCASSSNAWRSECRAPRSTSTLASLPTAVATLCAPSGLFAKSPQRRRWPHSRTTTWAWSR